jgi:hypothetical protein
MTKLILFLAGALPSLAQVQSVAFHFGDDPRWANPDFDERPWAQGPGAASARSWARYKMRIPERIADPVIGIDSATMEVYVDGRLIAGRGRLPPSFEDSDRGYSVFPIPPDLAKPGRIICVALRMWDPPGARFRPVRANPPALAIHAAETTPIYEQQRLAEFRGHIFTATMALLMISLVVFAGRAQHKDREFVLALASWSGRAAFELASASGFLGPWARTAYCAASLIGACAAIAPLELLATLVALRPPWWVRVAQGAFAASQSVLLAANLFVEETAWSEPAGYSFLATGFLLPLAALGLVRSRNKKVSGGLLLPMLLTLALAVNACVRVANAQGRPLALSLGSMELAGNTVGFSLLGIALAVSLLRRFRTAAGFAAEVRGQLAAARSAQEMVLAGKLPDTPGYIVDAAYLPADEVGGDFFRVLPAPGSASLVVIGDVSGKGLGAAILVSVIVGALLNRRSSDPSELLSELNAAIAGQLDGEFITCCAVLLEPDYRVRVASAGHPAPCFKDAELDLPPGLPLGVVSDASYQDKFFYLDPGDQLSLMSDGVAEACNASSELFGFDRARRVSSRPAAEIASAARSWGQKDDITVVTVKRKARVESYSMRLQSAARVRQTGADQHCAAAPHARG